MDDTVWLSTNAAAELLGVTPRTVYRFIDEGDLAAYKFGRVLRVNRADAELFVESCRVEPGSLRHLYPATTDRSVPRIVFAS